MSRAGLILVLVLVAAAGPAAAQLLGGAKRPAVDQTQPIEISAGSMEVDESKRVAMLRGRVKVLQGGMRLDADQMDVYYHGTEKGGTDSGDIQRILANGAVRIHVPDDGQAGADKTATADQADYVVASETVVLVGNPVVITSGQQVGRGSKAEFNLRTGHHRFIGSPGAPADGVLTPGSDGRIHITLPGRKKPEAGGQ